MKLNRVVLPLTLVTGIAIGFLADRLVHAKPNPTGQTILMTVDLDGSPGKEAKMWTREIAPGESTPRHFHPGDVVSYVLEGSVVHNVDGKAPVTFSAGQTWRETAKDVDFGSNASATVPVKILGVQITDKGQPATILVK